VKRPSPNVVHQLSSALAVPYSDLMRLTGHPVPGSDGQSDTTARSDAATDAPTDAATGAATGSPFADLTDDERSELLEYLAWYRARKKSRRDADRKG
jgi:hypothetical protein